MGMISKGAVGKAVWMLSVFLIFNVILPIEADAENVIFKYVAVNPSSSKTQSINIQKYLPVEVTPDDIVDSAGLEVEYDTAKSLYYVYKQGVELNPKEIRTFEVEVSDIWLIPDYELAELANRTDGVLAHLEGTGFYTKAKGIADTIYPRLEEIRTSQLDDTVSRQTHIGLYRENLLIIEDIKEDIAALEKILVTAGGPPAPEMLADTKITAEAPTKTMTWIVIFVIIIFLGLLGGVMFFTWHHQARITKENLEESRKAAFAGPERESGKE